MSDDDFLFQGLDDPSPPTPSGEMLDHAVSRGRSIRRRRHGVTLVTAAGVLAAVGGVAAALNAHTGISGQHDTVVPANSGSPTPGSSPATHPHRSGEPSYLAGYPGSGGHQSGQPGTSPCTVVVATASPSASPADSASPTPAATDSPAITAMPTSDVTIAPTPSATSSPTVCPSSSPSTSPTAEPTGSPSASSSDSPIASPAALE